MATTVWQQVAGMCAPVSCCMNIIKKANKKGQAGIKQGGWDGVQSLPRLGGVGGEDDGADSRVAVAVPSVYIGEYPG